MNGQIDIGDLRPSRYFLVIGVVLGLAFFLVSPDDDDNSLLNLAILWQIQTLVPLALAVLLQKWIVNSPVLKQLGVWIKLALSGLLASAVATPIALVAECFFENEEITEPIGHALAFEFLNIFPVVTLCWLAINAPFQLGYRLAKRPDEPEPNSSNGERELPLFYGLMDYEEHGDLIYLKSELHYLSVHTTRGNSLILYSLTKAVSELGDSGMQVHRSYWVSDAHVKCVYKSGREGEIELPNDERIPVSRRKLAIAQDRYN